MSAELHKITNKQHTHTYTHTHTHAHTRTHARTNTDKTVNNTKNGFFKVSSFRDHSINSAQVSEQHLNGTSAHCSTSRDNLINYSNKTDYD